MQTVDRLMKAGIDSRVFPGGVLMVSVGSRIICHRAFGVSDLTLQRPVKPDDLFDLASLTKPLATAMAVLRLVDENRLALDGSAGDYVEELGSTGKAGITVEQLLRHESGLPAHRPYYRDLMAVNARDRRSLLRKAVAREPLEQAPGMREVYSDIGYMLLCWIIETVSGMPLDRFVRDRICRPLSIDELFFIRHDDPTYILPVDPARLVSTESCPWRGRVLKGEVHDDNAWAAGGIDGHAGLFGSAAGVWRLLREILTAVRGGGSRMIPGRLINRFVERRAGRDKVAGFDTPSAESSSSGRYFSAASLGHLGFTGTSFWMDPDKDLVVILLTNRVHPSRENQSLIRAFRPALHDCVVESLNLLG